MVSNFLAFLPLILIILLFWVARRWREHQTEKTKKILSMCGWLLIGVPVSYALFIGFPLLLEERGLTVLDFVSSVVITSVIGLTPALLIRYVFVKGPINKRPAITLCVVFWFAQLLLFIVAFGSTNKSHTVLVIIAVISYKILTKGLQKAETEERLAEYFVCKECDSPSAVEDGETCGICGGEIVSSPFPGRSTNK